MKQEELCRKLTEMIAETKAQKLSWRLEVQTTEGNDASEKPIEEEPVSYTHLTLPTT